MRTALLSIWLIVLLGGVVRSQDELEIVKQVAPDLYPPAAHAVRAHGEVRIEVKIDSTGHVVSAEPLNGHPLLKGTSIETAKKWEFSPSQRVKLRTANLFFNYLLNSEYRIVDSAEQEEVVSVKTSFPSAYVVEIIREVLRPRFLLLPRKDGKVIPHSCPLHPNASILIEVQKRCESDPEKTGYINLIFQTDAYVEAESTLFPLAKVVEYYELCGDGKIESAEVQYCTECRLKRESWLSEKGN